jgi:TPR repeat protein
MTELYEARRAYQQEDFVRARELFATVGAEGDPRAWCALASMLSAGLGGPPDPAEAARMYRQAADCDLAEAAYNLAALYAQCRGVPKDLAAALGWYLRAAELGDPDGDFVAGVMYAHGEGTQQNTALARQAWERAAARGQTQAMVYLGHLSLEGEAGEDGPPVAAARWYLRAADGGLDEAVQHLDRLLDLLQPRSNEAAVQFVLGEMHFLGYGARRDPSAAVHWFEQAAAQGQSDALRRLAECYRAGDGVARDQQRAAELYERAAVLGDASAQGELGRMCARGLGAPRDLKRAEQWLRPAAEQGNVAAQVELARLLLDHGDRDTEAAEWLERAAAVGDAGAMINRGLLYRDGRGGPRDLVEATRCFFEALGRGLGDGLDYVQQYAAEMTADQFRQADMRAGGDGAWAASAIEAWVKDS